MIEDVTLPPFRIACPPHEVRTCRRTALDLPVAAPNGYGDFFGTDDFVGLVDVLLGFDDVLRDRVEDDRDRPPFWATTVNGRRSMAAASATPIRLVIPNLLSTQRLSEVK